MEVKEKGIMLLGSALAVDMDAVAVTNIFTVPLLRFCLVTHIVVIANGDMSSASFGVGRDAGGVDGIASAVHANLDGATKYATLMTDDAAVLADAADIFKCGVTIAHGAPVTADIYVFGFLVEITP